MLDSVVKLSVLDFNEFVISRTTKIIVKKV